MASQPSGSTLLDIRHRIQAVTIQPAISECPIKLEVLVDGQTVHKLSTIDPNQTLRWDMQTYPCDVHQGSTIGLRFIEKHHTSPDREVLVKYTVSDAENETSITKDAGPFPSRWPAFGLVSKRPNATSAAMSIIMTVKFLDFNQIASNYSNALDRATKMVEETRGPLDKLGNSRETLKTILGFGVVAAELHPIAKLVVGICAKAWEHLEKIQKQHEDLKRLLDGLTQMQPFIDAVKNRAQEEVLEHVVLGLLKLIEDALNYIINSMHRTSAGRTKDGLSYTREPRQINELLERLGDLKEQFDRGIGVQVLNQVLSTEQRALINQLKPTVSSLNNTMPSPCHEGTRTQVIADIRAWHRDVNNPQKLLWLYGQAGMGKSSIAASVSQAFLNEGTLGAHFFFKRDDPYLRSPEHMLNLIVHRLALRYEPYGRAVASAIEGYSGLLDMPLGQRFAQLVEHPLRNLGSTNESPPTMFAIVVDALDECEDTDGRRPLFNCLRKMSQLIPWIKMVVTSRPDTDIEIAFDGTTYSHVSPRSIANYDASSDILIYTRMRMEEMASRKKRPRWSEDSVRELSTRAVGLFVWAETACKFIERGVDMKKRLEQVLAGTQPSEGSAPLDQLYTTAIKQAMGDEGEDNLQIFRECIGAIVVTGSRKPLPIASLESLLSNHMGNGVFHTVVSGLGSVLYEDARQGGAVRVYHPSFADFILDRSRSGSLYTDPHQQHVILANCSLSTMMRELRFNICGLETSHILNRDVPDLETRVQTTIRPHLAYSCMHWSSHLTETPGGTLQDQLGEFLYGQQLLYWVEVMSLLGQTNAALESLLELINWAPETMKDYSGYANDTYRFILTFYGAISQSTPHLYISALPFAPIRSKLARRMQQHFPNTFVTAPNTNTAWPTWLQSIPHDDAVNRVACSANGRQIVSGCREGAMQIWDSETGAALSEPLSSSGVIQIAISPNGQRVASCCGSGRLMIWDTGASTALSHLIWGPEEFALSLTFSFDGSKLFCAGNRQSVLVWNANTMALLFKQSFAHEDFTHCAAVSLDEYLVAFGNGDGIIRIWDIKTGNLYNEFLSGSNPVRCVAFSSIDQTIVTGSNDGTVRIWEVGTGRAVCQPMIGHSGIVYSVAFSPDGRYIVSGSIDMTVRVWDVDTAMPACNPLVGHTDWVLSVAFCSNSQRAVSASHDKTVLIWDVGSGANTPKSHVGHKQPVRSVAFSSDGRYVASGSWDGTVRVWDAQSGDEARKPLTNHSGGVQYVAFIPDNRRILSLAGKMTVQIHDIDTGALTASFALSDSDDVESIALSPDGRRLALSYSDGLAELWDVETGTAVHALETADSAEVVGVGFSSDNRLVACRSEDGTIQIWEAETGAALSEPLRSHSDSAMSCCFSPDSRRIACDFDYEIVQVWDIETRVPLLDLLHGHKSRVCFIAFTPSGRHLISGLADGTVWIWDAETGAAVAEPLKGHLNSVQSIALSPDGCRIATSSGDRSVRIWGMENLRIHDHLVASGFFITYLPCANSGKQIDELFTAPPEESVSTSILAHYANKAGWVTSGDGALLLWLPLQRQRPDDSLIQISMMPIPNHMPINFSRFVHGDSWALVAGGL